jgi:hypothetical protein
MNRIVVTAVLILFALPAWADFQDAHDAYYRGEQATALKELRPLAEQGEALAQRNLGVMSFGRSPCLSRSRWI